MPSIDRPLTGEPLHFRLGEAQRPALIDHDLLSRSGRSARTLLKEGPLRVTLVALGAGGALAEHHADGPITVHVLAGRITFRAGEDEWLLGAGVPITPAGATRAPCALPHSWNVGSGRWR